MATVILSHRVNDFNTWKPFYEADKPRRDATGINEIAVGQKSGDPGLVYMIWDVKDPAALQKMVSDPELAKVMKEAGVISAPELVIIE